MARAARLEHLVVATRVRPVSNVLVSQGFWHNILEGFATLPLMKGRMDFVHGEAWFLVGGLRSFTQSRQCCTSHPRETAKEIGVIEI